MIFSRETSSEELYPMNNRDKNKDASLKISIPDHNSSRHQERQVDQKDRQVEVSDDFFFPRSLDDDVNLWSTEDVMRFIRLSGQEDIAGKF
jgi:hypothetical protein